MSGFTEEQIAQLREITGQRHAPRRDWVKLGLSLSALLGILFGVTTYLFVPSQSYASDQANRAVELKAQQLFNDYIKERVGKLERLHTHEGR